jgi:hypothetical protein
MWDSIHSRLFTMSYYNTITGSFVVIQTWCWDPVGSTCPAGSSNPVWLNNDIGTYPVSNGIQNYTIEYMVTTWGSEPNPMGLNNSGNLLFLVKGQEIAMSGTVGNEADAGLFVNTGTVMHVYTFGGVF